MVQEKSDHGEPRERDKTAPEEEPREKSLRLWEPLWLSLLVCLPQLILTSYFAERQF